MGGRRWTDNEIQYIKDNLNKVSVADIAKILNRTKLSIKVIYQKLGLTVRKKNDSVNIGDRFGMLVVQNITKNDKSHMVCECKCDCGNTSYPYAHSLSRSNRGTRSCGCNMHKRTYKARTHGMTRQRLYTLYRGILNRCNNNEYYKDIDICDEWKSDFIPFYKWSMENGYRDDLTLDRLDNEKGYFSENCRWTDRKTQANNKRNNFIIEAFGETKTLQEWLEDSRCQTTRNGIKYRLDHGYTSEEAISFLKINKGSNDSLRYKGIRSHNLYKRWITIKDRCYNEKAKDYKNYGGRGIVMCSEWKDSYENFYEWNINNGYKKKYSLDRIDNNGNYEPSNCRWTDIITQSNNKSTNKFIEAFGERKTYFQWVKDERCKAETYSNIANRIVKFGWSPEDAISTPVRRKRA